MYRFISVLVVTTSIVLGAPLSSQETPTKDDLFEGDIAGVKIPKGLSIEETVRKQLITKLNCGL